MDTPHIVAVEDVRIASLPDRAEDLTAFYADLLGLDLLEAESDDRQLTFRAYPRSGPQLVIALDPSTGTGSVQRPPVVIQVASLEETAELMDEAGFEYAWSRGLDFYDRHLALSDPAGNTVQLITRHEF